MKKTIGNKIKILRHSRGLQQNDLVELLSISQASLSSYENGKKLPSIDLLVKLSNYFDVSLEWLCGIETSTPFHTGTDLINTFLKIKSVSGFNYDIEVKWENTDIGCQRYITTLTFTGASEGMLEPKEQFDVNSFSEFMQKYTELEKKLASLDDDEIAKEYKKMWLEKELSKYSSIPLSGFKENSVKWDDSLSELLTNDED